MKSSGSGSATSDKTFPVAPVSPRKGSSKIGFNNAL